MCIDLTSGVLSTNTAIVITPQIGSAGGILLKLTYDSLHALPIVLFPPPLVNSFMQRWILRLLSSQWDQLLGRGGALMLLSMRAL